MGLFKKYVTSIVAVLTSINFVTLLFLLYHLPCVIP